jgi:hypothetical protein
MRSCGSGKNARAGFVPVLAFDAAPRPSRVDHPGLLWERVAPLPPLHAPCRHR